LIPSTIRLSVSESCIDESPIIISWNSGFNGDCQILYVFGTVLVATCPISSIKGEVKKKHFSAGWKFSCFAAHIIEQDLY